jgi:hypothetical protein
VIQDIFPDGPDRRQKNQRKDAIESNMSGSSSLVGQDIYV